MRPHSQKSMGSIFSDLWHVHIYTCTYIYMYIYIHNRTCTLYMGTVSSYMYMYMYMYSVLAHIHTCMYMNDHVHSAPEKKERRITHYSV